MMASPKITIAHLLMLHAWIGEYGVFEITTIGTTSLEYKLGQNCAVYEAAYGQASKGRLVHLRPFN
jgi:hypothetical protein